MRKALVYKATGVVVNVIELNEGSKWTPPDGMEVIDGTSAGPGDTWDGEKFIKPTPTPPPPDVNGFIDAVQDSIDPDRMDKLMSAHPTAFPALVRGNFSLFKNRLDKMFSTGLLTQVEFDLITGIMDKHNIPKG